MAIVPLVKIRVFGSDQVQGKLLDGLQTLGCVHLVSLQQEVEFRRQPVLSAEFHEAMRFLRTSPVRRPSVKDSADFVLVEVVAEAVQINRHQHELQDEYTQLKKSVANTEPWGEFRAPEPAELNGLRMWFYAVPRHRSDELTQLPLAWYLAGRDHRFDYVVVFSVEEPDGVRAGRVDLDRRPLSELRQRLAEIELTLEDLGQRRIALTRWLDVFAQKLVEAEDREAQVYAARMCLNPRGVFVLQGWVPRHRLDQVQELADRHTCALVVSELSDEDQPPTLLSNPEPVAGGQEAVTFYMTPHHALWDPSLIVFFSFALFFAMILSDAGYAVLLGCLLAVAWRTLSCSDRGRRVRNLWLAMVIASVVYGVLIGSFFGQAVPVAALAAAQILDVQDAETMMLVSIVIGVLHLVVGLLAMAWLRRRSLRALASLGWVAALFGGLFLGAGSGMTGHRIGIGLLVCGALGILLFSSNRPQFSLRPTALMWRLLDGTLALSGVSQAFGDVLSYLRLFALGLASAQLALTFNSLAAEAWEIPGLGVLVAVLIAIVGHGVNLVLAVIGGVVHGLRLNYIEFFHWSLPEEGYPFRAFARKAN